MKALSMTIVLALSLLALASTLLFEKKGDSSIQQFKDAEGRISTLIKTQDYRLIETYSENQSQSNLLDIRKEMTTFEGMEGFQGKLQLSLYKTQRDRFDSLAWQIKEEASAWSFHYEPQLIITTLDGCCGAQTGARAYNYKSGQLIMSYTPLIQELGVQDAPFVIEIPNTQVFRLVGVISSDSARDFPPELIERDAQGYQAVAIIKYADQKKILQKVLVKVKVSESFSTGLGEVGWVLSSGSRNETRAGRVTLWDIDGQPDATAINHIALSIKIYGESSEARIRLPVVNDRFNLSQAEVPAGVQLVGL